MFIISTPSTKKSSSNSRHYLPCDLFLNSAQPSCSSCAPPVLPNNISLSLAPGLSLILLILFFFENIHSLTFILNLFLSNTEDTNLHKSSQAEVISNLHFLFPEIIFFFPILRLFFEQHRSWHCNPKASLFHLSLSDNQFHSVTKSTASVKISEILADLGTFPVQVLQLMQDKKSNSNSS